MTVRQRLRRAWHAFNDYPGRRMDDNGLAGTLVRCHECGGSGTLHRPDVPPPVVEAEGGE